MTELAHDLCTFAAPLAMTIQCTNIQYESYATLEVATFPASKKAPDGANLLRTLTPPQVTTTKFLNFLFPISNFFARRHAQKQMVKKFKKKKRENLASHDNFTFDLAS